MRPLIGANQVGYMEGRSRFEHIISLMEFIYSKNLRGEEVCTLFVDVRKAFDTVNHKKLIKSVGEKLQLPPECKFIQYLLVTYANLNFHVKVGGKLSAMFTQTVGTKQGCTLSPMLFIIYFDEVNEAVRKAIVATDLRRNGFGRWLSHRSVLNNDFADDIVAAGSRQAMRRVVEIIGETTSIDLGLAINQKKTKLLRFTPECTIAGRLRDEDVSAPPMKVWVQTATGKEQYVIEECHSYPYLGYPLYYNLVPDVKNANKLYQATIREHKATLESAIVPAFVRAKILNTYIIPKLLANAPVYGMMLMMDVRTPARKAVVKIMQQIRNYCLRATKIRNETRIPLKNTAGTLQWQCGGVIDPMVYTKKLAVQQAIDLASRNGPRVNRWLGQYLKEAMVGRRGELLEPLKSYRGGRPYNTPLLSCLRYIAHKSTFMLVWDHANQVAVECNVLRTVPPSIMGVLRAKGLVGPIAQGTRLQQDQGFVRQLWWHPNKSYIVGKINPMVPRGVNADNYKQRFAADYAVADATRHVVCYAQIDHLTQLRAITSSRDLCIFGKEPDNGDQPFAKLMASAVQNEPVIADLLKPLSSVHMYLAMGWKMSQKALGKLDKTMPQFRREAGIAQLIRQGRIKNTKFNIPAVDGLPARGRFEYLPCRCGAERDEAMDGFCGDRIAETVDPQTFGNKQLATPLHVLYQCKHSTAARRQALKDFMFALRNQQLEWLVKKRLQEVEQAKEDVRVLHAHLTGKMWGCISRQREANVKKGQPAPPPGYCTAEESKVIMLIEQPLSPISHNIRLNLHCHFDLQSLQAMKSIPNLCNRYDGWVASIRSSTIAGNGELWDAVMCDDYLRYCEASQFIADSAIIVGLFPALLTCEVPQQPAAEGRAEVAASAIDNAALPPGGHAVLARANSDQRPAAESAVQPPGDGQHPLMAACAEQQVEQMLPLVPHPTAKSHITRYKMPPTGAIVHHMMNHIARVFARRDVISHEERLAQARFIAPDGDSLQMSVVQLLMVCLLRTIAHYSDNALF